MHSELEQLLVLQDRQQKIRQIQAEIKTVPLERAHLESQLAATAAGVEALVADPLAALPQRLKEKVSSKMKMRTTMRGR